MKTAKYIALALFSLTACKAQKKETSSAEKPFSYAEISVKTDGKWENRKYIGGSKFKNVDKLNLAPQHTDHSFDIRYEGPGWESNKVAYRLYLDWRNAIDIFGKKTDTLVLPYVGQDGFDSYHEMSDWGADILKAGKGIGVGSIARYTNNETLHFNTVTATTVAIKNGKKESVIHIKYDGWKTANDVIDFTSTLKIKADDRITQHTIQASKNIEGIATGIVRLKNLPLLQNESQNKKWAYIATYGAQTLVSDTDLLGMVVFYETAAVEKLVEGEHDHLVLFKPATKANTFYFAGVWEQEKNGITNKEDFIKYIDQKLAELNATNKM